MVLKDLANPYIDFVNTIGSKSCEAHHLISYRSQKRRSSSA